MLFIKLLTVPFFIGLVSLIAKRWGNQVAGVLSGMPVVAGPIIVLISFDQGIDYAKSATITAIAGVSCLLFFGVSYCWLSQKFKWYFSFIGSLLVWYITANILIFLPNQLGLAIFIAFAALMISPRLLPKPQKQQKQIRKANDLPIRMITGGIFTFIITSLAYILNEKWSGVLAVFPVIGSVLAIFTHITQGSGAVVELYQGTIRGLYSLVIFFIGLAIMWGHVNFWLTIIISLMGAILIQVIFYLVSVRLNKRIKVNL